MKMSNLKAVLFLNHLPRHSAWRKIAKKERRKRIRQSAAECRKQQENAERERERQVPGYAENLRKYEAEEAFRAEEEARQRHEAEQKWLKTEEESQKQWLLLQDKIKAAREERVKQNLRIKLEWEREQKKLEELKKAKEMELEANKRRQQQLQDDIEHFISNGGATPEHLKTDLEMNPNKPICPFFQKTASCRFKDSCSRNHIKPGVSRILLIHNFYSHYSLEASETEHGDSALEFENDETYSHFKEFFVDIVSEFERFGKILQLKVCCNREPHLRGNVYVEYSATREALTAYRIFNGRWYGGKQLNVTFCKVASWRSAICGLYGRHRCPKGSSCNFLHVFRNPNNRFNYVESERKRSTISEESDSRNWRWSESPERISKDNSSKTKKKSREKRRKRSRSRESKRRSERKRKRH